MGLWHPRLSLPLWAVAAFVAATAITLVSTLDVSSAEAANEAIHPPPANPKENRVVDGSAEGLAGWEGSGFVINGSWHAVFPAQFWGPPWGGPLSAPVFEALSGGASVTQIDSLSDLASSIDAGTQSLWAEGDFGGSGPGTDGAYMTVQLLNGASEPVGTLYQYGPPSPSDRLDSTMMVPCGGEINVPPGVRMARITARAEEPVGDVSTGTADKLALRLEPFGKPAVGYPKPAIPGNYVRMNEGGGQGPNCGHAELFTITGGSPKPTDLTGSLGHTAPPTSAAHVSSIELSRLRLALRVSAAAKLDVIITPVLGGTQDHAHRAAARQPIKLMLTARAAGLVVHRFRHRLAAGRYHLRLTAIASSAVTETHISRILAIR